MRPRLLLLGLLALSAGCSNELAPGVGIVRFDDGEPVQSGSIEFRASADGTRYSSRISKTGDFQLVDPDGRKGIQPGEYDVIVLQIVLTEDLAIGAHQHGHTVPRRYADYYTSDLEFTVEDDQSERIEIELAVE